MSLPLDPAAILKSARAAAGLSQRAMAERAGTAQSVVARIELGQTDPTSETLVRLLRAAGLELRCDIASIPVAESHMLDDVNRILALSPEERLIEIRNLNRFLAEAMPSRSRPSEPRSKRRP